VWKNFKENKKIAALKADEEFFFIGFSVFITGLMDDDGIVKQFYT